MAIATVLLLLLAATMFALNRRRLHEKKSLSIENSRRYQLEERKTVFESNVKDSKTPEKHRLINIVFILLIICNTN